MMACDACRACCWGDMEMPLPLSLAGVDGPVFIHGLVHSKVSNLMMSTLLVGLKRFLAHIVMHMLMLLYDMW